MKFLKNKSVLWDLREEMAVISEFMLTAGVNIPDVSGLRREYKVRKSKIIFSLSAQDYGEFFTRAVKLLKEPLFFFVEIPADNDSVRTYYLDNCTEPVAQAVLERCGGILYADGVIKFGFGSHSADDEIYMQEYQTVSVCSERAEEFEKLLDSLGYKRNDRALLTWDVLSEQNVGECVNVDVEGEGYPDMLDNLIDIGMYPAE